MNGKITISRYNDFGNKDPIHILITDVRSGIRFCDVQMSLENFTKAITGVSLQDCEFFVREMNKIGMKRELKHEFIQRPEGFSSWSNNEKIEFLKPYNIDGWEGSLNDLENHHNFDRKNNAYDISFVRWVDDAGEVE